MRGVVGSGSSTGSVGGVNRGGRRKMVREEEEEGGGGEEGREGRRGRGYIGEGTHLTPQTFEGNIGISM